VLHTGAGQDRDALCACEQVQGVQGRLLAQRLDAREEVGDWQILLRKSVAGFFGQ
jgi:hypothetical protein